MHLLPDARGKLFDEPKMQRRVKNTADPDHHGRNYLYYNL